MWYNGNMKFNLEVENIKYLKIVYKDKNDVGHFTKAAVKSVSEREIIACAKFEDGLNINTPQDVSLSFVCENGLYKSAAQLKFIENSEPYVFFTLKTPEEMEYKQSREYFRVKMDENVILSFGNSSVSCKIYDISANGIRIKLNEEIEIPKRVKLDILFADKDVKTDAEYIRTDNEDGILKASFCYKNLAENIRDIISQKCIQKQLIDKRNALM